MTLPNHRKQASDALTAASNRSAEIAKMVLTERSKAMTTQTSLIERLNELAEDICLHHYTTPIEDAMSMLEAQSKRIAELEAHVRKRNNDMQAFATEVARLANQKYADFAA